MADEQFMQDIMGFNPSDLSVFNEPVNNNVNTSIYKTNPKDSKAEDGHYHARVRVIYNPFNWRNSIIRRTSYAMNDANGFFMVDSVLGNNDRNCPIFKAWKQLHFSQDPAKKEWAKTMFRQTNTQWVLVQIIEDDNQPDLVGQFKVWKLPKVIFEKMSNKMHPTADSKKAPQPLMDYLIGTILDIDVQPGPDDPQHPERKQREISYSLCDFDTDPYPIMRTDGTALFNETEMEIIETYAELIAKQGKGTIPSREKAKKDAEAMKPQVVELYKKAISYLKENALDVEKECSYHPWTAEQTTRVNNWISLVLQMQDPKTVATATAVPQVEQLFQADGTPTNTTAIDPFAEAMTEEKTDDLPF